MGTPYGAQADEVRCVQTDDGVLLVVIGRTSTAPFDVLELLRGSERRPPKRAQ